MKRFGEGADRGQSTLFPECLDDWIEENNAVRVIDAFVDLLDPRSLKSIAASVALPAWLLGHDPSCRIITVSYSEDLARKHARDCRIVIESDWYSSTFPATRLSRRKNTETEITTTHHGFRLATSIGGTLTGRGGNVLIIDDPIKPTDAESEPERRKVNDWYDKTLFSRLDNKEAGAVIVVMQRLHEDDLTGYLMEKGEFDVLALPAIAIEEQSLPIGQGRFHLRSPGEPLHPAREGLATLESIKTSVGSRVFEGQYQQSPVPAEGNLFKASWLRRYAGDPGRGNFSNVVQSWDTATKVHNLGHSEEHLLLARRAPRSLGISRLAADCKGHAERHQINTVLIEDANSGAALVQSLRQETRLNIIAIKVTLDKATRAAQQSAALEAGRVLLPEAAPWLVELERELLAFPNGRHDDQIDSMMQFLRWAAERARYEVPIVAPIVVTTPRAQEWSWSY